MPSEPLSKKYHVYNGISGERLTEILEGISNIKVALIGDICLDIYWKADMTKSELSRETPHFPLPIVDEWMSPGGGGNAAANLAALNPSKVYLLGVIGLDWRGNELIKELEKRNINTGGIVRSSKRVTNAYCKPLRKGISDVVYEDPRIDFENFSPLPHEEEEELLRSLEKISGDIDVLCISDQMRYGCITPLIRKKINEMASGLKVVVDSRDRIGLYHGVILKPNVVEGFKAVGIDADPSIASIDKDVDVALKLAAKNDSVVCMTLGSKGCIYVDANDTTYIPSYDVKPPLDTCGAGDTFLSAFSSALAAGAKGCEAASIANMASDVTIKKIGMTGTASIDEIKNRYNEINVMKAKMAKSEQ